MSDENRNRSDATDPVLAAAASAPLGEPESAGERAAVLAAMAERRSRGAQPGHGDIVLPFEPNEDPQLTCIYCKAEHCAFALVARRPGETAWLGLCAACRAGLQIRGRNDAPASQPWTPEQVVDPADDDRIHYLKCWPDYFAPILDGRKRFEFRENDRNYQVGDVLCLAEWEPTEPKYTGRHLNVRVTYMLDGGTFGLPKKFCVMSIEPLDAARMGRSEARPDPYKQFPEDAKCKCGLLDVPAGAAGVSWYWQRHGRDACTLELPNERCWCGRLRSEHLDGHDETAREALMNAAEIEDWRARCGSGLARDVSALFVEHGGIYTRLVADCWGESKDARNYDGPNPVVAHPPCQLWVNLAHVNYKRYGGGHNRPGNDGGCFASALYSVRRWGGVLEHPAGSNAWEAHGLTPPGETVGWRRTALCEWVAEVWQSAYGHKARKRTWLFYCGRVPPLDGRWSREPGTHQVGWFDREKPTLGKKEASRTPDAFAEWLLELARRSTDRQGDGTGGGT